MLYGVVVVTLVSLLATGQPVCAQDSGTVAMTRVPIFHRPVRETMADILKRQAEYEEGLRSGRIPRPPNRAVQNPFGEEAEEALAEQKKAGPDDSGAVFPAPPYLGDLPVSGHFVPKAGKDTPLPTPPQTLGTNFTASTMGTDASVSGFYSVPPDTQGAVGPNHIVVISNLAVRVFNKAGVQLSAVWLDTFFDPDGAGPYPRGGAFDPRVVYDRLSGRWFATTMEFGVGEVANNIILAVSATSDPTGSWTKFILPVGIANTFTDYSTLGVDSNGVYIGATFFPNAGNGYTRVYAIPKAALLTGTATLYASANITNFYGSPQPPANLDDSASGSRAWFVASSTTVYGNVHYRRVSWSGSTPTIDGTTQVLTTPTYGDVKNVTPSGSGTALECGDDRVLQAVIRNNRLWIARNVGVSASGTGAGTIDRTACEWIELNVSTTTPSLVQSGRIYDNAASTPRFYFYPALSVNGFGDVALGFSGAKSTEFINTYTCGRLSTDAIGTMQGILQTKAGVSSYNVQFGGGRNRWGDYSYTMVDPADDLTLWTFQTFAGDKTQGYTSGSESGNWAVQTTRLLAPAPTYASVVPVVTLQGQNRVSVSISGTRFYDPGVGFPSRPTATVSGTGVTVSRVAITSATTAIVSFDVSASASVGTRDITLTLGDGQSVTAPNAVAIKAGQPQIGITRTIARVGGNYEVTYTLSNIGAGTATNVTITASSLKTTATSTGLPIVKGSLAAGASVTQTLVYPGSAGTAGEKVAATIKGTYTGGSFTSSGVVTLP
jgi:hypothetical protein